MRHKKRDYFFLIIIITLFTFVIANRVLIKHENINLVYKLFLRAENQKTWKKSEGEHCFVYYKEDIEEAKMIVRLVDTYTPLVISDFSWDKKEKLNFYLYQDEKEMKEALDFKDGELLPMGAYYEGRILVLSTKFWNNKEEEWEKTENFLDRGPIVHEIIHYAVDEITDGNYPIWLTEGVALYYEKKYIGFEWEKNQSMKEIFDDISIEELTNNFNDIDTSLAYRKSYEYVDRYVNYYGEKKLQNLIHNLGSAQ